VSTGSSVAIRSSRQPTSCLEQIDVVEDIRPFQPDELNERLANAGFSVDQTWWNYAPPEAPPGAQFFTIVARVPG
jgi:hypothetical protein